MEALIQSHKFVRNHIRINVAHDDEIVYYNKKPYLKKGIYSNTLRTGDLFSLVKSIYPNVNEICLNRDVQCRPHKDKTNVTESHIIFWRFFRWRFMLRRRHALRRKKQMVRIRWQTNPLERAPHWNEIFFNSVCSKSSQKSCCLIVLRTFIKCDSAVVFSR